MIREVFSRLLDLVYPPKCVFCGKILERSGYCVCGKCEKELHYNTNPVLSKKADGTNLCLSPLEYTDEVRESLLRYKFGGCLHYAETYSRIVSKIVYEYSSDCDIITWVPLSRKRKRSRGYDQAQLIAEGLSNLTGLDCKRLLVKTVDNPAQSGTKSAAVRAENVKGVYAPADTKIKGRHVLLVDDIITTGSTVSECAKTLKKAGAASVTVVTVAAAVYE